MSRKPRRFITEPLTNSRTTVEYLKACGTATGVGIALLSVFCPAIAAPLGDRSGLSEDYSMTLHPAPATIDISAEQQNDIEKFFHRAERAIEAEDLDSLMVLYSERYTNLKNKNKEFARGIWTKIFANFDDLSSRHSMTLINYHDQDGHKVAVTECSGLLTGTPNGENARITIDSWDKQRHVLVNEDSWKLLGNAGKAEKRYGAGDAKTHPLF